MTRREWLASIGRVLVAGAGVSGLAQLARRDPEVCISQGICRGCRVYGECGLPQALSMRQALAQSQPDQEDTVGR